MLDAPHAPLVWPEHFPPKSFWKRFFIGLPWLGPDLRFFRALGRQQAKRTVESMDGWLIPQERQIALMMGRHLSQVLEWKTEFFLPDDRFEVIASGPRFFVVDGPDVEQAIAEIEKEVGVTFGYPFWRTAVTLTFGEVIKQVVAKISEPPTQKAMKPTK